MQPLESSNSKQTSGASTSGKSAFDLPACIDMWCQPVEPSLMANLPEAYGLLEKSGSAHRIKEAAVNPLSIQDHVALMDAANVRQAAFCAWYRPGKALITNAQVHQYCAAFPNRFIHIASVDLSDPVAAVEALDNAVFNYGAKGLRMVPWLWNLPPNDKLYYPLLTRCVQLDIPFCTQVGHTGPLFPSEWGRPYPYLDEIALRFPKLKIIAGHIGYPWVDEMIGMAWKYENVYIDTSAYLPRYYPQQLVHFMKTNGKKKVLFGTNFPQLDWKRCMEDVHTLNLSKEIQKLFLYENAARVLKVNEFAEIKKNNMNIDKTLINNTINNAIEVKKQLSGAQPTSKHTAKL